MNNEKNREKFINLAEKRVTRAIKDLRLIGNLSNKTNYSYTEQDVKKIITALKEEVKELEKRFADRTETETPAFKLD